VRRRRADPQQGAGVAADLDAPDAPDAPDADPEQVARTICLRQLTAAPRTRAQLAQALARRRVPAEAAERVLDRLVEVGLVDDAAYAEAWVRSRHAGRGLARRALSAELTARGVDQALVTHAVGRLDPREERETARRLVVRRLASTRGLDPRVRVGRLAGMLARKGYPAGLAVAVARDALAAEGAHLYAAEDADLYDGDTDDEA